MAKRRNTLKRLARLVSDAKEKTCRANSFLLNWREQSADTPVSAPSDARPH
ncbi:MAG: hypothetical protein IJ635_00315 [Bacteroidaceae bacterium]|nr:hypothetical protein [Bacteroidaceae bacterium]MBR1519666.1 hypothetical protein [Bacteroidaceae bacterium]